MDVELFHQCMNLFMDFLSLRNVYFGIDLSNFQIMVGMFVLGLVFYFIGRILE